MGLEQALKGLVLNVCLPKIDSACQEVYENNFGDKPFVGITLETFFSNEILKEIRIKNR